MGSIPTISLLLAVRLAAWQDIIDTLLTYSVVGFKEKNWEKLTVGKPKIWRAAVRMRTSPGIDLKNSGVPIILGVIGVPSVISRHGLYFHGSPPIR